MGFSFCVASIAFPSLAQTIAPPECTRISHMRRYASDIVCIQREFSQILRLPPSNSNRECGRRLRPSVGDRCPAIHGVDLEPLRRPRSQTIVFCAPPHPSLWRAGIPSCLVMTQPPGCLDDDAAHVPCVAEAMYPNLGTVQSGRQADAIAAHMW